jgi:rhodanese-related sulfurtransferase
MISFRKRIGFSRKFNKAIVLSGKMELTRLLMCLTFVCSFTSVIFITGCDTNSSKEWERIKKNIQSDYPNVSLITTEDLHNLLAGQDPVKPILLDTREPEEYAVSHLPGAYLATTEEEALGIIAKAGTDRQIVLYCAVGYRSTVMAKKLQAKGVTKVYNLEGSIFKWANEGREIYQGDQRVNVVHPYNSRWRQLLDKRLWSKPKE